MMINRISNQPALNSQAVASNTELSTAEGISIVIPTYQREQVLVDTLEYLTALSPAPFEILLIDQTPDHENKTEDGLQKLEREGGVRRIKLERPSITGAMNTGLREANGDIVLFLDDDIVPDSELIAAHAAAHVGGEKIVAGQVLQPGEEPERETTGSGPFRFASDKKQFITELMGGNFSVNRRLALDLGGFDENFVHVAYKFEAEFAERVLASGARIFFQPEASICHLKAERGGTRSYGHHLTTVRPSHSVGAYYFLLRSKNVPRLRGLMSRPLRAVRTKHHLTHPWWIPATIASEVMGLVWAVFLYFRGPRLLNSQHGR
jgi:GT2 family glycosyltransferase